jgi:hypothetical protein
MLANVNLGAFLLKYAFDFYMYIRLILLVIENNVMSCKKKKIKLEQPTILTLVKLHIFASQI